MFKNNFRVDNYEKQKNYIRFINFNYIVITQFQFFYSEAQCIVATLSMNLIFSDSRRKGVVIP